MQKRAAKRKSSSRSCGLRAHAAQLERAAGMVRASITSAAEMKQQLQDTTEKFEELRFRHDDTVKRCRVLESQLAESKRLYNETNARLCTKSHELSHMTRKFKVDISLLEKEVHRRCDLSSEEIFEVRRLLLELQSTLSRFGFNDDKLFRKLFDCIDSVISLVHREVEVDADERPHRHEPVEPAAVGAEHDVISLLNPPDPTKKEKAKWRFKRSPIKRRSPDRPMTSTESVRTTTAPPLVQPCTTRQRSSTVQPVLNEARPKAMGIFTTEKENVETLLNRTASSDILKQYLVSSPADDDRVRNNPAASVDDQTSTKYDPPEKDGSRQAESLQQLSILKEAVTGLRQVSQSSICEKLGRIQSELSEQKKSTEQLLRQNRVLVENITESSKRNIQMREQSLDRCSEVDVDTAEEIPTKDGSRGAMDENVFDGNTSTLDAAMKSSPFSSNFDSGVNEFERRFQALQLRLRNPPLQRC